MEVMTVHHPRWKEFAEALEGSRYCNFHEAVPGDKSSVTWTCLRGHRRPFARALLAEMGNFDVEASLEYFERNGGHCDCEILFNVFPEKDSLVE